MAQIFRAIGLMSGTSADGIDAALITTDGENLLSFGPFRTRPYSPETRALIKTAYADAPGLQAGGTPASFGPAEKALTAEQIALAADLIEETGSVDLVGFHGQTVFHAPDRRVTVQLGEGATMARALKTPVVTGFRQADVAAGGQGAPFVPVYHRALARAAGLSSGSAVLNLGGVGNITLIGADGQLTACDTGPANGPIDDWMERHTGAVMDRDGALAALGKADEGRIKQALDHPYFTAPPPKSLDRNDFTWELAKGLSPADGAATLAALVAETVRAALDHAADRPARIFVTGGGRHNPVIMGQLRARLGLPIDPVEAVGWRGDVLEAEAFAFLAVRSVLGLPLSEPGTTGVPRPLTGGVLHRP